MKETFLATEFNTLDLTGLKLVISTDEIDTHVGTKIVTFVNVTGIATIDYAEYLEIYTERLQEALSEGEQLEFIIEGFIMVESEEFQVMGYKYNYETNKIELEVA